MKAVMDFFSPMSYMAAGWLGGTLLIGFIVIMTPWGRRQTPQDRGVLAVGLSLAFSVLFWVIYLEETAGE